MKTKINFLILSLILFSSNLFGYGFINKTKQAISIIDKNSKIHVLGLREVKKLDIENNFIIQINDNKLFNIKIPKDCCKDNYIRFEEQDNHITIVEVFDQNRELAKISLDEIKDSGSDVDSESDKDEELEDSKQAPKDLKSGSLFTFKNFAIVGILGAAGYFAWNYYQKSQDKKQK